MPSVGVMGPSGTVSLAVLVFLVFLYTQLFSTTHFDVAGLVAPISFLEEWYEHIYNDENN
jgi:hypothetical protein